MKKIYKHALTVIKSRKQPLITSALLACVVVSYQNCQQKEEFFLKEGLALPNIQPPMEASVQAPSTEKGQEADPKDEPLCKNGSSSDLICNPLGGGSPGPGVTEPPAVPVSRLGLIANLYEGQEQWNNIEDYFKKGYRHPENIYFSSFNVPTRSFSDGFGFGDDDYLKNKKGEKLIEWFALQARGHITLPETEAGGSYHIMTLSDDGIKVTVGGRVILTNPNTHAPTVDCAVELVHLNKGEEKSFELSYFQGPRFHIALMTFIKKIEDPASHKRSKLCSTGKGPADIIAEGYKLIGPSWFTLPTDY